MTSRTVEAMVAARSPVTIRRMYDPLKVFESDFRAVLPADESPRAAVSFQLAFGSEQLERSPEELAHLFRFLPHGMREELLAAGEDGPVTKSRWEKVLERGFDAVTGSLIDVDVDKLIGGVAAAGHVGSVAHRLSSALRTRANYCLVTDRRLLFVEHKVDGQCVEVAAVPRQAVIRARRAGKFMQRGRVVLDFIDLSQLALMTGMLFTGPANRLVAALSGGMVREGD